MRISSYTAALAAAVFSVSGAHAAQTEINAPPALGTTSPGAFRFAGASPFDPPAQTERNGEAFAPEPLTPIRVASTSVLSWSATARKIAINSFGWDGIANGKGVVIAILDSGIDLDHPEFAGRVLKGACFGGYSTICTATGATTGGDPGVYPKQDTHGTHVAGIAAGSTVGLANAASILPVKICDTYTSNCPGDVDSGMVWASQHGAKVINLSVSGSGLFGADITAAATAIHNGALIVVAAGNEGRSTPAGGFLAGAALKNGVRGGLIVVGATGQNNQLASFSQTPGNTCETYSGTSYCMRDYFVVAPGKGIKSSVGGGLYATYSGTSMATPYVSGVAALIKGLWPKLTPYQVANIIFQTADDLGAAGPDDVYGRGAVDISAALSPVGGPDVIAVTGGTTLANAEGIAGAIDTAADGVFSAALSESTLLERAIFVDSYGRDFNVNLTKLAHKPGFSLAGILRDPFQTVTPFALSEAGFFGVVSVSGFVEQDTDPHAPGAQAPWERDSLTTTHDLSVSLSPVRQLSFDFGHNLDLSGYFNGYDVGASRVDNGLFLSAATLNSPYTALADGGNFSGVSFAPTENLRFRFGYASAGQAQERFRYAAVVEPEFDLSAVRGTAERGVRSTIAGAYWDFASWGGVGLTATRTLEQNATLGGFTAGAFSFADRSATDAVGLSARVRLGGGWVTTLAYNEGFTGVDLTPGGLATAIDPLRSRAYGIGFTKHFLFGNDAVGFALTRPLHIYQGDATLRAATGIDADRNLVFGTETLSMASTRPETDVEFGYMTRLLGGGLVVQMSGAYQMDVGGLPGNDAVTALTRIGLRF